MSKVAIQGNASGTGTLTVAAPNTNSDYTLTLPAETGTVLTSGGAIDVNASAPADAVVIDNSGNIFSPYNTQSTSLVVGGNGAASNLGARVCIRSAISAGASLNYALNINDSNTNTAGGQNLIAWSHNSEDYSAGNVRAAIGATIDGGGAGNLVFRTGGFGSQAEQMRIDSTGNLKFNSGYGSAATAYGCRAWVNFNGTGAVAIRASGNVSSITDNGAGLYRINFATAIVDANYAAIGGAAISGNYTAVKTGNILTTTECSVETSNPSSWTDAVIVSVAIFR